MISLKGKTILVVDDEMGYREILSDEFISEGAEVITAENGEEAIALYQSRKIDVVISDVRMSGGSGIELLDRVKTLNAHVPVIMLITGFSDFLPEHAYNLGADAVFSKPCKLQTLVEAVQRALLPEEERWAYETIRLTSDFNFELNTKRLEDAIIARNLNLGRGGFFLRVEESELLMDSRVAFRISGIEGIGICRWVRTSEDGVYPKGAGVEILSLTHESIQILLEILRRLKPKVFIPKGLNP